MSIILLSMKNVAIKIETLKVAEELQELLEIVYERVSPKTAIAAALEGFMDRLDNAISDFKDAAKAQTDAQMYQENIISTQNLK